MESLALSVITITTITGTMLHLRRTGGRFRFPIATLVLAAVTALISVVGDVNPEVLDHLGRNRSLLVAGQWWRLVTPLFVQDGIWLGTLFNISALIIIGLCTESLHRRSMFLIVYFVAGLVSEVFAYTLLPGQGFAGNSVANMGAAGLCLVSLYASKAIPVRIIGVVGVVAGVALIATANLHGVGFAVGSLAGLAVVQARRRA